MGHMNLNSRNIRQKFFDFFKSKNHHYVLSSSLIPSDSDGLLFTNAGMVPFKELFSGKLPIKNSRLVSCQKCLRMNDLENIGESIYHHSFFEMLGNFSFGDYFKKEAILMSWEFLIDFLKLDPNSFQISVHKKDHEAFDIWNRIIGLPSEKIWKLDDEDNFWGPVGKTGVCGFSSEIYYQKDDQFIEIWNIVFVEFFKLEDGSLNPLQFKGIDTGMGLERFLMVLENCDSVYESSLFKPIIEKLEKLFSDYSYLNYKKVYHVIADHIRAIVFLFSEGILPSKEGRGYVLRRVIRRALKFAYEVGIRNPFLNELQEVVIDEMSEIYPELKQVSSYKSLLKQEELQFFKILKEAYAYLDARISSLKSSGQVEFPSKDLFILYDSLGMPFELSYEYISNQGFCSSKEDFDLLMQKQKERGKSSWKLKDKVCLPSLKKPHLKETPYLEEKIFDSPIEAQILEIYNEKDLKFFEKKKPSTEASFIFVLNQSIFYAEAGGQIYDTGFIEKKDGKAFVYNVQKKEGIYYHYVKIQEGNFKVHDFVFLNVDINRKKNIRRNHSATHLLHHILFKKFNAKQMGSLVEEKKLRFDFSMQDNLSYKDIEFIESKMAEFIIENKKTKVEIMKREDALKYGAAAFFKDKYQDYVRVIKIADSIELCGGTHVDYTGDIGSFKITSIQSIGQGIKRIEAVTGMAAASLYTKTFSILENISLLFQTKVSDLADYLEKFLEDSKKIKKENLFLKEEREFLNLEKIFKKQSIPLIKNFSCFNFIMDSSLSLSSKKIVQFLKSKNSFLIIFLFTKKENNSYTYHFYVPESFYTLVKKKEWDLFLKDYFKNFKGGGRDGNLQGLLTAKDHNSILNFPQSIISFITATAE